MRGEREKTQMSETYFSLFVFKQWGEKTQPGPQFFSSDPRLLERGEKMKSELLTKIKFPTSVTIPLKGTISHETSRGA